MEKDTFGIFVLVVEPVECFFCLLYKSLRRFGSQYVFKYTWAEKGNEQKLLWPIDRTTLTNNTALKQTLGYEPAGSK